MKNTFLPSENSLNCKTWYLINAENKTLDELLQNCTSSNG